MSEAITAGLARDGGLYVPERLPRIATNARSLAAVAADVLRPFFEGEPASAELDAMCATAFGLDAPLAPLPGDNDFQLELFHGPTAAFKDYGAQFLAELLSWHASAHQTILVATSGDTGAAVAGAFANRPGFDVVILYPDGRVSPRQAHQLGAFGGNVRAFRVAGSFDDCQAMVKAAFADASLRTQRNLRSANSISLGRLLPQIAYYAHASLALEARGLGPVSFVVPTGNLGNAVACLYARQMGLPIDRVVLAMNANRTLVDYVRGAPYRPAESKSTLANAMDVGAPSNVERLQRLLPDAASLRTLAAETVSDEEIREAILRTWNAGGIAICPHTACGVEALRRLRADGATGTWAVAATAHAAKFETIVEPIIGVRIAPPPSLQALLDRPAHSSPLSADASALKAVLTGDPPIAR